MECLVVDPRAAAVGIVADEVLDLRHHVLRLNAFDFGYRHLRGEEWIFAKGVVGAAELKITVNVDKRLKAYVDAQCPVFASDYEAVSFSDPGIEGGGDAHGRGLALRWMPSEHARRAIGETQTWNPQ